MISLQRIINASNENVAREFLEIYDNFKAQVFLPTKPQADLFKTIGEHAPEKRIFLMTSGNGTGKSAGANNLVINLVYGNCNLFENIRDAETNEVYKGFFDYPFFNNYPENWPKVIWYVSNADSLDSIYKDFKKWAPMIDVNPGAKTANHIWPKMITFDSNDWEIYYKTVDQDPKTFESASVGVIIFDEPPPQKLYRAASSRLRQGGIIIIPATPLLEASWFLDEIINKIETDEEKWWQKVSVWTNCIEKAGEWDCGAWGMQKKGNLTLSNVNFTLAQYDPDELPARRDGDFMFLQGVVYKTYHQQKDGKDYHLRKAPDLIFPKRWMYRFVMDPHDRRPPAAIWIAFNEYGNRHIIREWPSVYDDCYRNLPFHKIKSADPYTIADFVKFWLDIEDDMQIISERLTCIIDPNFGNKRNAQTGRTVVEDYEAEYKKQGKARVFIKNVIDDLATGHKAVKALLKPTLHGDLMFGIDKGCYNCDYAMRNYQYDEWEGKIADKKEVREDVKEIGKDFADLIRYDAVLPFIYKPLPDIYTGEGRDYRENVSDLDSYMKWRKVKRPRGAI